MKNLMRVKYWPNRKDCDDGSVNASYVVLNMDMLASVEVWPDPDSQSSEAIVWNVEVTMVHGQTFMLDADDSSGKRFLEWVSEKSVHA